ncbi:MAG: 50S ribosomal protein L18 [Candidatus Woesearchaeota archaeon]|nr:50S ribosomal protein L18 [Candidatus Woesearchaeota archaeon]
MKSKKSNRYTVAFRRKREGRTDYRKRMALLKSGKDRLVIRRSLKGMIAQIVRYETKGDMVIVGASAIGLKKFGLKTSGSNIAVSYLVGLLLGKMAAEKGIKSAIADIGLNSSTKGSKIYAVVKGVIDAGLDVPASPEMFPSKERLEGKDIMNYAKMIEKSSGDEIPKYFDSIKKKITGGKS